MTALPTQPRKIQSRPEAPFVLPKPPRQACELIIGQDPVGAATLRRQLAALPELGQRLMALLGCQDRFLAELRLMLEDHAASAPAGAEAPMEKATQLLAWCEAVQQDLALEASRAVSGQQVVDLLDLCHDVQHDWTAGADGLSVQVHGHARQAVWGCVSSLERLLRLGLRLVADRAGQRETVFLEVGDGPGGPEIWIRATATEHGSLDAETAERFCELASEVQVDVRPDEEREGVVGIGLLFRSSSRKFAPDATCRGSE